MKHFKLFTLFFCIVFALLACSSQNGTDSTDEGSGQEGTTTFAKGADIGWVTEMEHNGMKFYNASGVETDCFRLMKNIGMNAIRIRVWVNPKDGWNGKEDVVSKAKRAKAEGMDLMIDFHYSDSWADPGQQFKPSAWKGKSLAELKKAIADHTKEIMNALKAADVKPKWVQVGNEIRPGMLWDEDVATSGAFYDIYEKDVKGLNSSTNNLKYPKNQANLAAFVNTGYDAVKSVFPDAIVIVHIDNAWDDQVWWFDQFKAAGGKMDMIGLSHYPQTHGTKTWQEMNALALEHIAQWASKYKVKVMVTEIGVKRNEPSSAQVMKNFMDNAKKIDQCAGVFYWEPESYGWNSYDMGAFTDGGRPSAILDAFK